MGEKRLSYEDILNLNEQKRKEIILDENRINKCSDFMSQGERNNIINTLSETSRIEVLKTLKFDKFDSFDMIMKLGQESRFEILKDMNIDLFPSNVESIVLSLNEDLRNKIIINNIRNLSDEQRKNIILTLSTEHRIELLKKTDDEKEKIFIEGSLQEETIIKQLEESNSCYGILGLSETSRIKFLENNFEKINPFDIKDIVKSLSEISKLYIIEKFNLEGMSDYYQIISELSEPAKIKILEKSKKSEKINTNKILDFTEEATKEILKNQKIKCSRKDIILSLSGNARKEFLDHKVVPLEPRERLEIILSLDNESRKTYIKKLDQEEKEILESISAIREANNNPNKLFYEINNGNKTQTLGLPNNMTIGVELEAEGKNATLVKALRRVLPTWKAKGEYTLEDGVEVVSPTLHDSIKDMQALEIVCNTMQQAGLGATENCGGHIHIGADYLENNPKAWENLLTIWNESEELFYKMSNAKGELPRKGIIQFAKKNHKKIEELYAEGQVKIENEEDFAQACKSLTDTRYRGLNLINLGKKDKNTIEFRMPNGTINPNTIKDNIKLFGSLLKISKEMVLNPEYKKEEFIKIKDRNLTEREKVEALLDLLFDNEKTKRIYRERWDFVKNEKIFDKLTKGEVPTFKRGNYEVKKDNLKRVANDPEAIPEIEDIVEEIEINLKEQKPRIKS